MAKFILAEKKEMTQKFAADGRVIPVTKVIAGPCVVTQIKSQEQDGYFAVQLGFGSKKGLSKSIQGHLKNLGSFRYLKEFRISAQDVKKIKVGDRLNARIFKAGDAIEVIGYAKGRGFQGVVKRHGFSGSPATHGHKDQLRMPGSIGSTGPQHVLKGVRMAGRMGGGQVTIKNLEVIEVNQEASELYIKGALPGARNSLLLIIGAGDLALEEVSQNKAEIKPAAELEQNNQEISQSTSKSNEQIVA
ncbi:MAG: 50S ribosomal protein L3 [Candidatus Buchananbacteria bacterium RIFCSPHIGHO2_01_FULL_39_14]|uniref:Large ribosomal subunit protein uL3 n=1 Tax=Candidatus Buchananbacteria bacterium RIFCSPHIGHO2_01_FULL_39_14 TaxID=1797532 RepID=A0A1G1XWG1_9BACT|nr:MAG: 50S ribosomal protein L3 [Candidatus Buchananbacteria bacterium RIFCSPHIGHO2_01_FULL_39_14]